MMHHINGWWLRIKWAKEKLWGHCLCWPQKNLYNFKKSYNVFAYLKNTWLKWLILCSALFTTIEKKEISKTYMYIDKYIQLCDHLQIKVPEIWPLDPRCSGPSPVSTLPTPKVTTVLTWQWVCFASLLT